MHWQACEEGQQLGAEYRREMCEGEAQGRGMVLTSAPLKLGPLSPV